MLHKEFSLRIFIAAAALILFAFPQPGHSEDKIQADAGASGSVRTSSDDQEARSLALAKEARDRSEALERARDRKMREVSKSICIGC